jgi:hypothetical protein
VVKRIWWVVALAIVIAGAWYWWWSRGQGTAGDIDLVEAFRGAEKRTPNDPAAVFSMEPQTIKGETKPAIYAHPPTRIIYHDIVVPPHARLELFLAIKEEAWDKGTDGVYFRVGISHGEVYKELAARRVAPYLEPADRGWIPLSFDLSEYAGQTINVVFNTHESVPGIVPNGLYDFAVFGAPRITTAPAGS